MNKTVLPELRIIHNLARSGGTLVGKALGCMQQIQLYSEIHPDAQHARSFNLIQQAQQWHNQANEFNLKTPFLEGLAFLYQQSQKQHQYIVLRDWAHVDFFGKPVTDTPSFNLALNHTLAPHYRLTCLRIVRDPIDTWLSFSRLNLIRNSDLTMGSFFNRYRQYLLATQNSYQLRYEDFLNNPHEVLEKACQDINIPFDANFIHKWHQFTHITGDNSNSKSLRESIEIRPREPKKISNHLRKDAEKNIDYQWIITHLKY